MTVTSLIVLPHDPDACHHKPRGTLGTPKVFFVLRFFVCCFGYQGFRAGDFTAAECLSVAYLTQCGNHTICRIDSGKRRCVKIHADAFKTFKHVKVLVGDTVVTASGRAPNIPKSRTYLLLPYFHPSSQLQH